MDATERLIEEVKNNECLYNLECKEYKNVFQKRQLWEDIGESLNLSGEKCRNKWKNLRDTYKKHKRNLLLPSGSGTSTCTKKWKYLDKMSFLDGLVDFQLSVGNVTANENDDVELMKIECSSSTSESFSSDSDSFDVRECSKVKKSNAKDNMDETERFIEAVRKKECLYNLRCKEYKNFLKKREIWEEIGESFNMTGENCRKKWKNLRDTFKKHKRGFFLPSGNAKKWKYLDKMSFLDGIKNSQLTVENVTANESDDEPLLAKILKIDSLSSTSENLKPYSDPLDVREHSNASKRKAVTDIDAVFAKTMKKCLDMVEELTSTPYPVEPEKNSSISIALQLVQRRILDAKVPHSVTTKIENRILHVVEEELNEYMATKNN